MKLQPPELANVQCEVCHGYATEHLRALDRNGLKWKFIPARGHIAAAPLAGDNELSPLGDWESECH
jgi:hypothetical protein